MLSQKDMSKTSLIFFVKGFKQKKIIQRHPIIMTDADYEIERCEKINRKGMWLVIVTRNNTDNNNHNSILYDVFHYRIIKYQYVNILYIFVCFSVLVSYFTVSCLSFLRLVGAKSYITA